ncbi:MAG TPA: MBL fold metallo-hydrolase [Opitutaceae bacterium]
MSAAAACGLCIAAACLASEAGGPREIAPGVFFREGDPAKGTCNNGWVVFGSYALVVDANYPVGARAAMADLAATTDRPVRYVVDTHFHPDHASGNELWAERGAMIVAQAETADELRRTGAARWAVSAAKRPDVASTRLRIPDLTFSRELVIREGPRRVELLYYGPAHTRGDTLVWLPEERVLFTGDVCVNGAFNYVHDGNLSSWVGVLDRALALGPRVVCPGHGPLGGPELLRDQAGYFRGLLEGAAACVGRHETLDGALASSAGLAAALRARPGVGRFVPSDFYFRKQFEKAWGELTGTPFLGYAAEP